MIDQPLFIYGFKVGDQGVTIKVSDNGAGVSSAIVD
jgi:hypothetical protein